jgi:hypothetical protein
MTASIPRFFVTVSAIVFIQLVSLALLAAARGLTKGAVRESFANSLKAGDYVWHPEVSPARCEIRADIQIEITAWKAVPHHCSTLNAASSRRTLRSRSEIDR